MRSRVAARTKEDLNVPVAGLADAGAANFLMGIFTFGLLISPKGFPP